uniref:Monodehydroascorbate reductase n=1 Tax=Tanacetum cinerariifolium TaxID=118510 RepID=A0A6L2JXD4_TANCI|nr:hypothetical protein [Tanacetum cinerariifolium]
MADINIPANDAPAEQAHAVAPPTRTDDQILPSSKWVPIGKSNCVLNVQKSQRNPIFPTVVAILKNTNFFRAFTASSTIPAIYIQQFWDTMCFNSSTGLYICQLDEQWFNLYKDVLRDALDITPTNDNNPYVAPPSSDTVIEYVNTLGYPSTLRNVSAMSINALYQLWRAILSMINMCLTGKTVGYDRPRHLVLQILWGIIHRSNIDYAKSIWEEFVQSIQTFLTDRKNLATGSREKKKATHLLIPNVRFTKLIIHHLKIKHNIHLRTGSPLHYSHDENVLNTLRSMWLSINNIWMLNMARQRKEEQHSLLKLPRENLKLPSEDPVIPEEPASSTGILSSLQNLEKELNFTDQYFVEKQQKEEPEKTNAEVEVQLMVLVPIHQDTSSVPPMTTMVIDLTTSQSGSPLPTSTATTSAVMTTKTIPPPPPQPQQSTVDPTLVKRIDELKQHMENLLQYNLALEERLDKHGSRLYKLENLNIPHQVSKAVDEIVTDAVDW